VINKELSLLIKKFNSFFANFVDLFFSVSIINNYEVGGFMKNKISAIYIHIPFCKRICSYCDFTKVFYNEKLVFKYLDVLDKEISDNYKGEKVETIYIGGGTPSSLSKLELERLFSIVDRIDKSNLVEFTIEVNPEDINEDKLRLFKDNGVNRISIGHETCDKKRLVELNRSSFVTLEQIELVKKYFDNINVDLMYGFNNQSVEEFLKDVDYIISLDIPHVSTYSLILEENTKLFIDKYKRLDDEVDASFYKLIQERLECVGLNQYEISNFAKDGYKSKHNLTYWNNFEYYGFGVGASGYIGDIRYSNTCSITSYIAGKLNRKLEVLDRKDKMVYEMILGLRKCEGVSKALFFDKYTCTINQSFDIMGLIKKDLLEEDREYIRIPKKYLYLENQILVKFLEVVHDEE